MKKRISCAIDCDDVLMDCNALAVKILNEKEGTNYTVNDITRWGNIGTDIDHRFKYMFTEEFYENQPVLSGAREFIKKLSELCDVYIVTATPFEFVGIRARRLITEFAPYVKEENIIMASSKHVVETDVLLDDGAHNIKNSICQFPVIYRQSWNNHAFSGSYSVNSYDEFLTFIKTVFFNYSTREINTSDIICLVGPSGSDKNSIAEKLLEEYPDQYEKPKSYSTQNNPRYIHIDKEEFENIKADTFEHSVYNGHMYALSKKNIDKILEKGKKCITVLDICGAISMRNTYPNTAILYISKPIEEIIGNILDMNCSKDEMTQRLVSIPAEQKNEDICDYTISSYEELKKLLKIV